MTLFSVFANARSPALGVSVAAVSKVLRNAYGVSDALRQNVMTSIVRLGYRPSVSARGMRGQTYTIGVLLHCNPLAQEQVRAFMQSIPGDTEATGSDRRLAWTREHLQRLLDESSIHGEPPGEQAH